MKIKMTNHSNMFGLLLEIGMKTLNFLGRVLIKVMEEDEIDVGERKF